MAEYEPSKIEPKWQNYWVEKKTFKTPAKPDAKKLYCLDMFPYPSGSGLHIGHPLGYTATDIYSRFKRQQGYTVLHPMGYDAFGLPAEQHAVNTGEHPSVITFKSCETFTKQMQATHGSMSRSNARARSLSFRSPQQSRAMVCWPCNATKPSTALPILLMRW